MSKRVLVSWGLLFPRMPAMSQRIEALAIWFVEAREKFMESRTFYEALI